MKKAFGVVLVEQVNKWQADCVYFRFPVILLSEVSPLPCLIFFVLNTFATSCD